MHLTTTTCLHFCIALTKHGSGLIRNTLLCSATNETKSHLQGAFNQRSVLLVSHIFSVQHTSCYLGPIMQWCIFLTYDPAVFALKCGAGACDGPTGAGAAERGATGGAVERRTWAVGAGRRRAAG